MNNTSSDVLEKVAEKCSSYTPRDKGASNSSCTNCNVSCSTCRHFDSEKYCKLDLYDKIVNKYEL